MQKGKAMKVSGTVGNVQLMQRINRARVIECIRRCGTATRPALAADTGLSLSSITNLCNYLLERGYIRECAAFESGKPGRRASLLGLDDQRFRIACVVAEADWMRASLMTLSGREAVSVDLPGPPPTGQAAVSSVLELLEALRDRSDGELLCVAASVPGLVLDRGQSVTSVALKWSGVDLRGPMSGIAPAAVCIQNASIARAIRIRAAIRSDHPHNALFLDLANGIGAVHFSEAVLDPTFLGELGHVTADIHGERCFCGNCGCLELYCSPARIAADFGAASYADVLAADAAGDSRARAALTRGGRYLGAALVTLIQLYAPDVIYINGHELLRSRIVAETAEQYARTHAYPQLVRRAFFRYVDLDAQATLGGLLDYALDRLFDVESSSCILE